MTRSLANRIFQPRLLGLDPEADNGDRCLGLFHVGMAKGEKIAKYRSMRGDVAQKTVWI